MDTKSVTPASQIQYQPSELKPGSEGQTSKSASVAASEQAKTNSKIPSAATTKDGVDVELSTAAREKAVAHRKAFDIAIATPEVREDRVAELKQKIQQGLYQPQADRIADGILREAVLEHLANQQD